MYARFILFTCFVGWFSNCTTPETTSEQGSQNSQEQTIEPTKTGKQKKLKPIPLTAVINNLRVRDVAGLEGNTVATLAEGETMTFLGEISDFNTKITIRGIEFEEPWLKVKTEDAIEGWIYAGTVKFDLTGDGQELYDRMITKRLRRFFDNKIVFSLEQFQKNYTKASTENEFALMYREGAALLDQMNQTLTGAIDLYDLTEFPDMFWVDESIPACEIELVAEGTEYQLFRDFSAYAKKAQETSGSADDNFMNLMLLVFPDGIEYYFQSWFLQTWDYGGYSLLGQGKHREILEKMNKCLIDSELFKPEIMELKKDLLNDIFNGKEYGEPAEDILAEIDAILEADYDILLPDEIVILKNRRQMFTDPSAHELSLNLRDGF